ncbi:MAG: hypothetical protein MJ016_08170 [Victivallaceae bacterium]|nr:hypothetical protein [Victivallaceae bacterium]
MKKLLLTMLGVAACFAARGTAFRIEAEKLNDLGKWQVAPDGKASGLKMLYSNQQEGVVAKGSFKVEKAGNYYLSVRALTMCGDYRKTQIALNGRKIGKFGDKKVPDKSGQYIWEKRKLPVQLVAGENTVTLTSTSGFSRIDALVFSDDPNFEVDDTSAKELPEAERIGEEVVRINLPVRGEKSHAKLLLFHGNRPWVANDTADTLAKAGLCVTCVNSVYLDGLGGASIKTFLTDKEEPKAKDGITPSFAQLGQYKAVLFTAIPAANMKKIFTAPRIEALKKYVQDGGTVFFNGSVPDSLQDILPVQLGGEAVSGDALEYYATRPEGEIFSFLPEKLSVFDGTCIYPAVPGAKVISEIRSTANDYPLGALIAEKNFGKGKVVFFAFNWDRVRGLRQIMAWAYGSPLLATMVGNSTNVKVAPAKLMEHSAVVPQQEIAESSVRIDEVKWDIADVPGTPVLTNENGKTVAKFANGTRLEIDEKGAVAVTYPGQKTAQLKYVEAPKMKFFGAMEQNLVGAEAVENMRKATESKLVSWHFDGVDAANGCVALHFSNESGKFDWEIKAGTLDLDKRHYDCIADRINVLEYKGCLQTIAFPNEIALGETLEGHQVKRLACYASPRGYAEFDYSGKKAQSCGSYGFFSAGQPFSWIVAPQGIYSSFTEAPQVVEVNPSVGQGAKAIKENLSVTVGRRKAPIATKFVWHGFSAGAETPHNDWMAMYQFQRHNLRKAANLKEIPSVPTASHTNTLSGDEPRKAIEAAGKLHFQQFHLQRCPSSIESVAEVVNAFQVIRENGMRPRPWTPSDYTHGDGEKVHARKDFFLRNPDGSIYAYSGIHPVLDMNNPDVQAWYKEIISTAVKNGMGAIYTDMGGTQTGNVNFAGEESKIGLDAALEIYKFYHDNGIQFGIEGCTPLGLNSYWYRRQVYLPYSGNEFALLGGLNYSNEVHDIDLDYFRMAMYDAFMLTHTEGYALQFERSPHEIEKLERIGKLNVLINEALETTKMPFIRETDFGTTWVGENGAAVFCYHPVKKLTVEYNGKTQVFENVAKDTILILKK